MSCDERAAHLRSMEICRFCLDDKGPLVDIHGTDGRAVPLPLQIMACVAIEVFKNDGMPQLICAKCKMYTQQAYTFKATCKKSDDALKLYLATGDLKILQNAVSKDTTTAKATPTSERRKKRHLSAESQQPPPQMLPQQQQLKKPRIVLPPVISPQSPQPSTSKDLPIKISEPEPVEVETVQEHQDFDMNEIGKHHDEEDDEDDDDDDDDDDGGINPMMRVEQVKTDVFACDHCDRSFPLKQLLDLHVKNHERERVYKCDQCDRKFFTKYDLGKHVQTHSASKPYECVVCNKTFSRETLLHRHEKIHNDVPKYLCTQCDRTFLTKLDMDSHMEKHNKKRPYRCHICNKSFVFKQGLERHESTHAEEKPHKCNYCEASFTSPIKLMRHITSHAGLRPYPCKVCGRTFLLSHHLTRHLRSHFATKNNDLQPVGQHKCDLCSMSFKRKDSLINHSTIHSMVNLKCVICNTAFDNAKQVMNHITTHLSGLPYTCDKCDYSFETQDQLEEHELKHAEMEYEEQIEKEVSQEEAKKFEEDEEDEEDVVEFTITNTVDGEIIRRPQRANKIKNYAQFLKDELGSDVEDEIIKNPEENDDSNEEEPETEMGLPPEEIPVKKKETIKPIVRSEGTKVYTRKNSTEKPKIINELLSIPSTSSNLPPINNFNLTPEELQALPNKQYVDMKVGDKTLRVQKLMMTKAEIQAMAKEGKIEMKGDTILLRKTVQRAPPAVRHTMETIIDERPRPSVQKPVVKKTYVKKAAVVQPEKSHHPVVEEEEVSREEEVEEGEEIVGD